MVHSISICSHNRFYSPPFIGQHIPIDRLAYSCFFVIDIALQSLLLLFPTTTTKIIIVIVSIHEQCQMSSCQIAPKEAICLKAMCRVIQITHVTSQMSHVTQCPSVCHSSPANIGLDYLILDWIVCHSSPVTGGSVKCH